MLDAVMCRADAGVIVRVDIMCCFGSNLPIQQIFRGGPLRFESLLSMIDLAATTTLLGLLWKNSA